MVFDWFNRGQAPQNPQPAAPEPAPEPPPADESVVAEAPAADPAPEPPSVSAPAPANPSAPAGVDQDALEWARQAYARLKAQQEAERQAAQAAEDVEAAEAAPPAVADAPGANVPASVQAVQESGEVPVGLSPDDVSGPAPAAAGERASQPEPEPAPETEPAAPASAPSAGLSLLELAAAQRAQRQQEIRERALDVVQEPAASSAATVPAPAAATPFTAAAAADEAAPQLGAFDDDFTWSAEVLAAQGRQLDDISLEEIDWLGRLRRGMEKTRRGFVTQLLDTLGDDPLSPEVLDDLETLLLRADVGVQATDQVLEALRRRMNEEVVDPAEGIRFLKEQLRGLLEAPIQASGVPLLAPERGRLNVWLMVGVNGVGKTTTLGKLANLAIRSGYSCLIAAADTFRAAAVRQVEVWGERSGVSVVSNPSANADPAAVVFDAIGAARAKGTDLVLVDTAGRLQTKHNLMEELTKVRRIVDKLAPEAVVQSLLVLDASQGQNGLKQAMAFAQAAGLTGVVLTKLDGSARGGVALAVASEANLPIRFIGAGEGIRDLRPFNSFEFIEALLAS
jgi:fused signal recognition particle receptor